MEKAGNRSSKFLKLLLVVLIFGILSFFLFSEDPPFLEKHIITGKPTPSSVVREYLELCREGEFSDAARYWTPGSEENFHSSFEAFCIKNGLIDWKVSRLREGKSSSVKFIQAEGELGGVTYNRIFYLKKIEGQWYLHKPDIDMHRER
jgi:hypothetical protein